MTRSDSRALASGVAVMAFAMLLDELLAFRFCAATMGHGFAVFVGLLLPAATALGVLGSSLGSTARTASGAELARVAAHRAALAGTMAVLGAIAMSWASQQVASDHKADVRLIVCVALAAWLVPAGLVGAAFGLVVRIGQPMIGRIGAVDAGGAVCACLLAPLVLEFGGARTILATGFLLAIAALLLGRAARDARPRWSMLATLPLAILALLAGDLGEPWMTLRIDAGRKTSIEHGTWTAQGHIAIEKAEHGPRLLIDRQPPVVLAGKPKGRTKPPIEPPDTAYALMSGAVGPVLVVGSAGGREIQTALSREAARVDAIEPHAVLVDELLAGDYADETGFLLSDPERVRVFIGDGRAALAGLGNDYQVVVVLDTGRFDQAAPRLLSRDDRRYTAAALAAYVARLRDDGVLLLSLPREGVPAAMAATAAALGMTPTEAAGHFVACSGEDKKAVLLVSREALDRPRLAKGLKRCKKSRLEIDYPIQEPPGVSSHADGLLREAEVAALPSEERPFLVPPEDLVSLQPAMLEALRDLSPSPAQGGKRKKTVPPEDPAEYVEPSRVGLAAAAVAASLVVLGVGAIDLFRSRRRARVTLEVGFPLAGVALALCSFALADVLLRALGNPAYGWALVIPLGLVGVGAGRLFADVPPRERFARVNRLVLGVGIAALGVVGLSWDVVAGLGGASFATRLALAFVLLVGAGWVLGFPLAAGVRILGPADSPAVARAWGLHLAGWALGGALAALLVPYLGVSRLWPIGLGAFAVAAVCMTRRTPRSSAPEPAPRLEQPEQRRGEGEGQAERAQHDHRAEPTAREVSG
jgi:hypothetical protein